MWNSVPPGTGCPAQGTVPINYYEGAFCFGKGSSILAAVSNTPIPSASYIVNVIRNNPSGGVVPNLYIFPPLQLNATDFGGPTKITSTNQSANTNVMFPFGGFAQVGHCQVPYIGSYMILSPAAATSPSGNFIIEINPVTADSALADDFDSMSNGIETPNLHPTTPPNYPSTNDAVEQVGRFCPLAAADPLGTYFKPVLISTAPPAPWACSQRAPILTLTPGGHVFDYFTAIQNPHDDYLPNVDPNAYGSGLYNPVPGVGTPKYTYANTPSNTLIFNNILGGTAQNPLSPPTAVANNATEDTMAVEGLININTASAAILARVPWTPIGSFTDATGVTGNQPYASNNTLDQGIATSIVQYRNAYGPFKTIFDLNKVPLNPALCSGFTNLQNIWGNPATTDLIPKTNLQPIPHPGTGPGPASDYNTNDFKTRFNSIVRVSNLLTTRSDTYTIYVLVQG